MSPLRIFYSAVLTLGFYLGLAYCLLSLALEQVSMDNCYTIGTTYP